jgi:hypothetical protein
MRMAWKAALAVVVLSMVATVRAETMAKTINWENEKWIPVNMTVEGVDLKEVRFEVEGGIHWNPLRAGRGPQAFVQLRNTTDHEIRLAVAIALFDQKGALLAASEASNIGSLDPSEVKEIKVTFREVKRKFFEAKTAQLALETWR